MTLLARPRLQDVAEQLRPAFHGSSLKYLANDLQQQEQAELREYFHDSESFPRTPVGSTSVVRFRPDGALVFKEYRIDGFRNVWRSKRGLAHPEHGLRFADAEMHNYLEAQKAQLPVPGLRLVANFGSGLRSLRQLVVLERLAGFASLNHSLKAGGDPSVLVERASDLMLELAGRGVFHMDFSGNNIMVSADHSCLRFIDLERVRWNCTRRAALTGYYYGNLYRNGLRKHIQRDWYDEYVRAKLHSRLPAAEDRQAAAIWFEKGCGPRLSRSECYGAFV